MKTAAEYVESLRERDLNLWVDGQRVQDPVDHPKVRPAIHSIAAIYAMAHHPEHRELAVAHSDIIDGPVNRFTHLFREPEDLTRKVELQRVLGRVTGTCFQRCVGMDGLPTCPVRSCPRRDDDLYGVGKPSAAAVLDRDGLDERP